MRFLGMSAVCLSLLFGAGGVVSRPLAQTTGTDPHARSGRDPAQTVPSSASQPEFRAAQQELDSAVAELSDARAAPKACGARAPRPPVSIDFSKVQAPTGFVSLNSRGYNYRQPGDPPQFIPDSTRGPQPPKSDRE